MLFFYIFYLQYESNIGNTLSLSPSRFPSLHCNKSCFFRMWKHIACLLVLKVAEPYLFDTHLCPRICTSTTPLTYRHTHALFLCAYMHGQQSSTAEAAQHHICVSWSISKRDSPVYTNQHAAAAGSRQTHVPPSIMIMKQTNITLRITNCCHSPCSETNVYLDNIIFLWTLCMHIYLLNILVSK